MINRDCIARNHCCVGRQVILYQRTKICDKVVIGLGYRT